MGSVGFGLLVGAQMTDIFIILNDESSIDSFCRRGQLKFGFDYSVSAGPIGREVDISGYLSSRGGTCALSYSQSKGIFAGVSLDGAFIIGRGSDNANFYGTSHSISEIINCDIEFHDPEKLSLIQGLHDCLISFEKGQLTSNIKPSYDAKEEEEVIKEAVQKSKAIEEKKEAPPEDAVFAVAASGKNLLKTALENPKADVKSGQPTATATGAYPTPSSGINVIFTQDHIVDEESKAMKAHNIISVPKGAKATLVNGTLSEGLGGKFKDYVEVNYNGKVGKVSRLVLSLAPSSKATPAVIDAPPPAIDMDTPKAVTSTGIPDYLTSDVFASSTNAPMQPSQQQQPYYGYQQQPQPYAYNTQANPYAYSQQPATQNQYSNIDIPPGPFTFPSQ